MRNRAKRLLREAFRLNRERLKGGVDYIFSPRNSDISATVDTAENAVLSLCRRAGLVETGYAGVSVPVAQDE